MSTTSTFCDDMCTWLSNFGLDDCHLIVNAVFPSAIVLSVLWMLWRNRNGRLPVVHAGNTNAYSAFVGFIIKIITGALALSSSYSAFLRLGFDGFIGWFISSYRYLVSAIFCFVEPWLIPAIIYLSSLFRIHFEVYPEWKDLSMLLILYTSSHIFHVTTLPNDSRQRRRAYFIRISGAAFGLVVALLLSGMLTSADYSAFLVTVICGLAGISVYRVFFAWQFSLDRVEKERSEYAQSGARSDMETTGPKSVDRRAKSFGEFLIPKLMGIVWLIGIGGFTTLLHNFLSLRYSDTSSTFISMTLFVAFLALFHLVPGVLTGFRTKKMALRLLMTIGNFFIGYLIAWTLIAAMLVIAFGLGGPS